MDINLVKYQEVFITLFLKKEEIKHTENIAGYLFTTLRHKILDIIRANLLYATHHDNIGRQQERFDSIDNMLEGKELEAVLYRSIQALPDKCREAFILSRYEQLPYKAIAAKLNISVNTVEKHIGKALRLLRIQLGEKDLLLILLVLALT